MSDVLCGTCGWSRENWRHDADYIRAHPNEAEFCHPFDDSLRGTNP